MSPFSGIEVSCLGTIPVHLIELTQTFHWFYVTSCPEKRGHFSQHPWNYI